MIMWDQEEKNPDSELVMSDGSSMVRFSWRDSDIRCLSRG